MKKTCLVLLAHGSRNPNWQSPFEALLKDLRAETGEDRVYLAYLQMATPSLSEVVRDLCAQGVRTLRILPLLMSAGNHADEDIPAEKDALLKQFPDLVLEVLPPIGSQPRFKAMMRELVKDSL